MTDYKKLLKFSKLLGVQVIEKPVNEEDAAVFIFARVPEIHIFSKGRKTHTMTIVLLHELGHAVDWTQMGRPRAREIPKALAKGESKLTPSDRRIIFEYESRAIENMKVLYLLLDLKIPLWKLEQHRRFDQWIAQSLLNDGEYPPLESRRNFWRQLEKVITSKTISSMSLI